MELQALVFRASCSAENIAASYDASREALVSSR
jgi:hypothetical protein